MKINNFEISNGALAQIEFQKMCFEQGIECFLPSVEGTPYDFVIRGLEKDFTKFLTIQVKMSYPYKDGRERLDIRKPVSKKPYKLGEFDYFAAFRKATSEWYFIPFNNLQDKSEINLNNEQWNQYKIKK
jgi:hypothetical protein